MNNGATIQAQHNLAHAGDIAKTVLMPGDPARASYIAQTYDDKSWGGTITDINSGGRFYPKGNTELPVKPPEVIASRVYIDGYDTEYIISKEVTTGEQ